MSTLSPGVAWSVLEVRAGEEKLLESTADGFSFCTHDIRTAPPPPPKKKKKKKTTTTTTTKQFDWHWFRSFKTKKTALGWS